MLIRSPWLIILLASISAFAQTEKAQLNGVIADSTQAAVPGAQVVASSTVTGTKRTVTTNEQGLYSIPFLDPGTYDIQVQKEGFRTVQRSGVKLDVAQTATLNFSLDVGAVSDQVTVTAQSVALDTGSASLAHTRISGVSASPFASAGSPAASNVRTASTSARLAASTSGRTTTGWPGFAALTAAVRADQLLNP